MGIVNCAHTSPSYTTPLHTHHSTLPLSLSTPPSSSFLPYLIPLLPYHLARSAHHLPPQWTTRDTCQVTSLMFSLIVMISERLMSNPGKWPLTREYRCPPGTLSACKHAMITLTLHYFYTGSSTYSAFPAIFSFRPRRSFSTSGGANSSSTALTASLPPCAN